MNLFFSHVLFKKDWFGDWDQLSLYYLCPKKVRNDREICIVKVHWLILFFVASLGKYMQLSQKALIVSSIVVFDCSVFNSKYWQDLALVFTSGGIIISGEHVCRYFSLWIKTPFEFCFWLCIRMCECMWRLQSIVDTKSLSREWKKLKKKGKYFCNIATV